MKKMSKSLIAMVLCLSMIFVLAAGCGVKTKDQANSGTPGSSTSDNGGSENNSDASVIPSKPLTLLYTSSLEKIANIVRDQLTKAGFQVQMSVQTDNASYKEQKKAGNYDIAIDNHSSPTGNPDFYVRPIAYTGGSLNLNGYSNAEVDAMIDEASALPLGTYWDAYNAINAKLTDELAWFTPLYAEFKARACVDSVFDVNTLSWLSTYGNFTFKDAAQNDTRTLKLGTTNFTFTTFDPIRADDASIGSFAMNSYIRLVDQDANYNPVTEGSLSRSIATSEDATQFYFLLRDDCFFTRLNADTTLQPTNVMVSGEDVVYSLNRARDKNSIPLHQTYSNFEKITEVALVTDLAELDGQTNEGKSILDALNAGLATPISELVATRDEVDNDAGRYQLVRLTTSDPFPQILAYLSNHSGGIVDSEWVESINSQVDFANYDASKDTLYGDFTGVQKANYANTISASGRYVLRYIDDYGAVLEKNPGYCTDDDPTGAAKIKNVNVVFLANADSALSALRSGDIDVNWSVSTTKFDTVRSDSNLALGKFLGQRLWYLSYNINSTSACSDLAVRKAVANAINLDEVKAGMGEVIVSDSIFMCLTEQE